MLSQTLVPGRNIIINHACHVHNNLAIRPILAGAHILLTAMRNLSYWQIKALTGNDEGEAGSFNATV